MPPLTQHDVFQTIQDKAKRKKDEGTILTKADITEHLKELYNPYLRGRLYFYGQDQDGLPIFRVPTYLAGNKTYCSVARENVFGVEDWQSQPRPTDFVGNVWPPKVIEDLIGDVDETEYAVMKCYVCKEVEKTFCTCGYKSWKDYWPDYWLTCLLLRRAGARGYGIFAREAIQNSTIVGEYTGRIKPVKPNEEDGEDAYCVPISIGRRKMKQKSQPTAILSALHTGSISRFINHSCNSNALLQEFRCGLERRVIYVVTTRDININEELTIDYGPELLIDNCLCGSIGCKTPPKSPKLLDAPVKDLSEDQATDEDEEDSYSDAWDTGHRSSDPEYEEDSEYGEDTDCEKHRKRKGRTH
ncbi:SET-like protein [Alternaria alternata]|nr:SET-like protein [Alternaria alternata]